MLRALFGLPCIPYKKCKIISQYSVLGSFSAERKRIQILVFLYLELFEKFQRIMSRRLSPLSF